MDNFHRTSDSRDTRNVRECKFCRHLDPDFAQRDPIDRMVLAKMDDSAGAHLTENGYVKHRIAELMRKRSSSVSIEEPMAKSA
jgi:hypothetical protein